MSLYEASFTLTTNLKMLLDALLTIDQRQRKMKEIFLRLEYLLRNKHEDYRIGQLMLCVF
jgi:hypothetical protein